MYSFCQRNPSGEDDDRRTGADRRPSADALRGWASQLEGIGAVTPESTLARFREYMVGPSRFMTLLSCFELGILDALRHEPGVTAARVGAAVGVRPDAVEQLLHLLVKEGFVGYDADSGGYRLDALAGVPPGDLQRALKQMDMIKFIMVRQLFHLTDCVRTGRVVGLKQLYGSDADLYGTLGAHRELREPWARLMDDATAGIDPWFFDTIDIPAGARVLDLAGNTGLGAIHTCRLKASPGLRVTTFDLPDKEEECLRNFREHGVAQQCSFIGGDVFDGVPEG